MFQAFVRKQDCDWWVEVSAWGDLRRDLSRLQMMELCGVSDELLKCVSRISAMGVLSDSELERLRGILAHAADVEHGEH